MKQKVILLGVALKGLNTIVYATQFWFSDFNIKSQHIKVVMWQIVNKFKNYEYFFVLTWGQKAHIKFLYVSESSSNS